MSAGIFFFPALFERKKQYGEKVQFKWKEERRKF